MAEAPHEEGGDSAAVMELLQQRAEGRTNFSFRCTKDRKVTIAVTMLAVMLLLTVTIIVLAAKKHPPCTSPTLPNCLESGIGFGNKCFYFLEEEVDWEGSQHSCLSRQAHLATIDSKEELVFSQLYWILNLFPWKISDYRVREFFEELAHILPFSTPLRISSAWVRSFISSSRNLSPYSREAADCIEKAY
ncbi:C-type lectin domain family 2 member F-like isoform X3 [Hirundo rustica]|uniref:C-type lectin domain family 2 member F-like isoform X3 n=1 Tax=Hirundo rustica TaxID=43150 RepID=UPI002672B6DD|nr:C-type lectin domain family 2 member F-like isoform X3 [Hirundo rustica]